MNDRRALSLIVCIFLCLLATASYGDNSSDLITINAFLETVPPNSPGTFLAASVLTDTTDYAPGDSVIITGGGFWADETVTIDITNILNPGLGDAEPWDVYADANGAIETYWIVPEEAIDQKFILTAEGQSSGLFASTMFTDGNTNLVFTQDLADVCPGQTVTVCAYLSQKCQGNLYAPLENRAILFFINPGDCGNDVGVVPDEIVYTDENGIACATLTAPSTPGSYSIRIKFEGESKPGPLDPPNSACDPSARVNLSASNECDELIVLNDNGTSPIVSITTGDTTLTLCDSSQICLPLELNDPECNVDSITTNLGQYSGTVSNFDQVSRINQLGGTVTQVGGGAPGAILYDASDFVSPINTHSGVSVTLPNFIYATSVIDYGPFPTGLEPGNSADHLLYAPTDMTFTTPGIGGPDGGDGDGSVAFSTGNNCVLGFAQMVTTCNGMNVDFMIFSNSNGGGTAKLIFRDNGIPVHVVTQVIPAGTPGAGIGGVTFDLPDGITFNEVKICCLSGTLEIDAVAVRTLPSSSSSDICFTADTSGVYEVIATAYDKCGNVGADTVYVTVSLNSPPIANAGNDFSSFLCNYSELCFGVSFTDPDNDIALTELVSPTGTLAGNQICFTPSYEGNYSFIIHAVDSCGNEDYDTVVVSITLNDPPVATQPDTVELFLCEAVQICDTLTATDPNGGTLSWSLLTGSGTLSPAGEYCFTPTLSGVYTASAAVTDSCGLADTISFVYDITINSTPVAVDPTTPVSRFLCESEEICFQFAANDNDNGSLSWSMLSGDGTLSTAGLWCFTPTADGSYSVVAVVTDSCGAADTTTKTYDITFNDAPVVDLGNDTTISVCLGDEICIGYDVSDPQGLTGIQELMLSGYGSIDTSINAICFTPASAGNYEFVVKAIDSCGAFGQDTMVVTVELGASASIDCPVDPVDVFLCGPDSVCEMLAVSPAGATVSTSFGTYDNGQLCFYADTAGTYSVTVIAEEECGADTCEIEFVVTMGAAAQINCPAPSTAFLCAPDTICVPVGVNGSGVSVAVSPIGYYQAGNVCFLADTAGHYEIEVIATTSCGSDTCLVVVDVDFNSNPVAADPSSPVDTFVCVDDQICDQFSATDVDGGLLSWSKLSGNGTVSSTGEWCFNTSGAGAYTVAAVVSDSCGASDTVSITYNVTLNLKPSLTLGADTIIFVCSTQTVCLPYTATDADGNLSLIEFVSGSGIVDTFTNNFCILEHSAGTYQYILKATDECGAEDVDTINITLDYNDAPFVNGGADQNIFQCAPTQICWPVTAGDVNGNLATVELINSPGTFDGSQICFTPDTSWCYEFVLKATDSCGVEAFDTIAVCVDINDAPVADAGADQTLFQCTPTQICLPAGCSDVDGNLSSCLLVEGPGSYDGTTICFTPGATGSYTFVLEATDACGLTDRDTVVVDVTVNSAPVCNLPNDSVIFQCTPQQVCLPVSSTDIDNNQSFCQIVSGPGSIVNGEWCYTPSSSQTVNVTVRCEDSCGAYCEEQFTVEFKVNQQPTISFASVPPQFLCASAEICLDYTVADPDDPQGRTITLLSGSGTIDTVNSQVCFTPTASGSYIFEIQVEDDCGETAIDAITVDVTLNNAPVADAGADQSIFLCAPTQICWPASCSDMDNNLTACQLTGPGTYSGTDICFTPTTSGTYQFILTATDACDIEVADTVDITVTMNSAPTIAFGNDTTIFLCDQQELCFAYTTSDPDGLNGSSETLLSGNGVIDAVNNQICFVPSAGMNTFIVQLTDSCGVSDVDTINVDVTYGESAQITCPSSPIDLFLCGADSISTMVPVSPSSATVSVSYGVYDIGTGELKFYADTAGTYVVTMIADESCGSDTCTITYNIDMNTAPVANAGTDQNLFQCIPAQVSWNASCSDIDGNLATCDLLSGAGLYNGSQIIFMPDTAGTYSFILKAIDDCGEIDQDTVQITITLNSEPVITAQADTTVSLCTPQEICVAYSVSDPDGTSGLTEAMTSGYGTIDTANNQVCFTPTTVDTYEIIVSVTDPCGIVAYDTVLVDVDFGASAAIDCPAGTIDVNLCSADTVCQMIAVTPSTATVSTSFGTYANGQLCFYADTSGLYTVTVIANETCGADTCDITFNVNIGSAATVSCPAGTQSFDLCSADTVCVPVGVNGTGVSVTVSPIGYYQGGNVCFVADTAGTYDITVIASTSCGSDTCVVTADVTVNSNPVAVDPSTPVDTFLCAEDQICYQFSATDVDGGGLVWNRLTGNGTVSSSGEWCFTAASTGSYCVTAVVTDDCGTKDTTTLCYDVSMNSAPAVTLPNDTSITICSGSNYCFNYIVDDIDLNLVSEVLGAGSGSIDTSANEICFSPVSDGSYEFIVHVTDDCGATDADTIHIAVTLIQDITITCPSDTAMYICGNETVCRPVTVSNPSATVSVAPFGTYAGGQVCFDADTSGHYVFDVIATTTCGADTCSFAVDITANTPPVAVDPSSPVDTFICSSAIICYQFAATDAEGGDLSWMKLSGAGTVSSDGEFCFDATASGSYSVQAQVTDSCGAADTVAMTYNVAINGAPQITAVDDANALVCPAEELCYPYFTDDPDNNISLEEMITPFGTLDTATKQLCFVPDTAGVYQFIFQVTDACGETDADTLNITVFTNLPPVANLGADQSLFQCNTGAICWPAECTDIDNNLATCELISPVGTYDGSQVCFTPDTSGVYQFILRATDMCGAEDEDTALVTVELNNPPVCNLPNDTSVFQCSPAEIRLPVGATDPDGNFDHCEIVTGPGSIVNGEWIFTPSSNQSVTVTVMCVDACGLECTGSFTVHIELNQAPVVDAGADFTEFLCAPQQICWPVTASDINGNLESVELISTIGTFDENTMTACFMPDTTERSYRFIFQATDSCGLIDYDTVFIDVEYNAPPEYDLPAYMVVYLDMAGDVCFDANLFDEDDNIISAGVSPVGTYDMFTDEICFNADTSGLYCLTLTAEDDCGEIVEHEICIQVDVDECLHVQIEKTHGTFQGEYEEVKIFLNGSGKDVGGFDLLVAYDQSALSAGAAEPGDLFVDCGWEYFTYRFGESGNCDGACPSGLLRVIGIAETNNGAYHPQCFMNNMIGDFVRLKFLVSNDRTLECQYAPIQFFWIDCGDNSFSSRLGDTLWVSRDVYEFEGALISDYQYGFPGYYGAHDDCLIGGGVPGKQAIRCVDYTNGGIDIVCADSIDAVGDVNLNEIPYEIADAVLYSNYFIYGLSVFTVNTQGQIAASDVNKDGLTLSVADMVYLIRVIVGDAPEYPKINPANPPTVEFSVSDYQLAINSTTDKIGAISLVLEGNAQPSLHPDASNMELRYNFDGENTRVLVYNLEGTGYLTEGTVLLLNGADVKSVEAGSFNGVVMAAKLNNLPERFELFQNYPNPFNPMTTIRFALPHKSDYELVIYNILGQVVERFENSADAGYVKIEWDASKYASGVYFYRLRAGEFSGTKKMVLLK